MSRIRSIHPGLWTDESFVSCSPFARLLAIGLWNECDDQGVFEWKPLQIKMKIFAGDNIDVSPLLDELTAANLCARYEVSGRSFGAVRNFGRFQRPRKPKAIHPLPLGMHEYVALGCDEADEVPQKSEPVPQKSEIPPQMEDEGGDRLEVQSSDDDSPSGDEPTLKPEHVFEFYREMAAALGLPVPRDFTPERRQLAKGRIAQHTLDDFQTVFAKCRDSPFLRGDRGRTPLTIDWLLKKGNFQKVLEGNYDS